MKINENVGVERRSLAEQLYETIKELILNGEISAGMRIPEEATEVIQIRRQLEILSVSLFSGNNSGKDIRALKRLSNQCKKFFKSNNISNNDF